MPMNRGAILVPVQHVADNEEAEFPFTAIAARIGLEDVPGAVEGRAMVRRVRERLRLTCEVHATRTSVCDRCLETFGLPLEARFEQWYAVGTPRGGADGEARTIAPEDRDVVIDEDVRENLVLAIPMKVLCREDCRGLCPECGANWNVTTCPHRAD